MGPNFVRRGDGEGVQDLRTMAVEHALGIALVPEV